MRLRVATMFCVLAFSGFTGCSSKVTPISAAPAVSPKSSAVADKFPSIVSASASAQGETWTFAVTVSSPYDTPERYADGWRVRGPDGKVYGEHSLDHDHATEQPFTRTQPGVAIPNGVDSVTIEGRDKSNGYGGRTVEVALKR